MSNREHDAHLGLVRGKRDAMQRAAHERALQRKAERRAQEIRYSRRILAGLVALAFIVVALALVVGGAA